MGWYGIWGQAENEDSYIAALRLWLKDNDKESSFQWAELWAVYLFGYFVL